MFIISHRGNLTGPDYSRENHPDQILYALSLGYEVEVDVWCIDNELWLGHDAPTFHVPLEFLQKSRIWAHAKNIDALYTLTRHGIHTFFHDRDDAVLTSKGIIWTYPGKQLTDNSIAVMPETHATWDLTFCLGVCTDYPLRYRQ